MLVILIIIYLLLSSLVVDILFHLLKKAPLGWEDEQGFHFGYPVIDRAL